MRLRNFQQIQTRLKKNFANKFAKKLSRNFSKLTEAVEDFTEQLDSANPKQVLGFALDLIKPYLKTLGLRVSRLSESQIEVVLPYKELNATNNFQQDEGAICTAAIFAYRTLWKKNAPKGPLEIQIKKTEFERVRAATGTLHLRLELPALARETIFVELAENSINHKYTEHQNTVHIYDLQEQLVAQVVICANLILSAPRMALASNLHGSLKRK